MLNLFAIITVLTLSPTGQVLDKTETSMPVPEIRKVDGTRNVDAMVDLCRKTAKDMGKVVQAPNGNNIISTVRCEAM